MQVNVDCMEPSVAAIERRLEVLTKRTGQRALVVGQSRGGTFGRVLAARRPELVETLVTLGSPVLDQLAFRTPAGRIPAYLLAMLGTVGLPGLIGWSCLNGDCCARSRGELAEDLSPDVRYVAFYSRRDDVVRWEACLDHRAELVEVSSSHLGMGVERKVWCAMAERFSLEGADR